MKYFTLIAFCFFASHAVAQSFWLGTKESPGGAKTSIAGMEDTVLFVGTLRQGVWKSRNAGNSWRNVLPINEAVYSLCVSPARQIIAGGSGKVFYSSDKGETWDSAKLDTPYPVTGIINDQDGGFFAITSYSDSLGFPYGDGVFYSDGDVAVWRKRNHGLPAHPVCDHIAMDSRGTLYLATTDDDASGDEGLFISHNKGMDWIHIDLMVKGDTDPYPYPVRSRYIRGLTITPQDSVILSFAGLGANFEVRVNSIKHIQDIESDREWKIVAGPGRWDNIPRTSVHHARNGDRYSSIPGLSAGGTVVLKKDAVSWEQHKEGLGIPETTFSTPQYFYETWYGKLYMIQYADERVYWTDQSIVNGKKISGKVTDTNGHPRMIEFEFMTDRSYQNDHNGAYSITVPSGWSGRITPYRRSYTFNPAHLTITNLQSDTVYNIVATFSPVNYLVAGKVVDALGLPVAGVPVNGLPEYIETNENGIFEMALPAGWSGTLSPYSEQCSFVPASYKINDLQSQGTNFDFERRLRNTFVISGTATDNFGQPIPNVSLDGLPCKVKTDENGTFVAELPGRWSGQVVPDLDNYRFIPSVLKIMDTRVDLQGLSVSAIYLGDYTVSGTIADLAGSPIGDLDIAGFPEPVKTNSQGQYLVKVPPLWSGSIHPVSSTYIFDPESITIAPLKSDISNLDFWTATVTAVPTGSEITSGHPYPNPSSGVFSIDLPKNCGKSYLEVFSATGIKVSACILDEHQENVTFTIDQKGFFILRLSNRNGVQGFGVIVE